MEASAEAVINRPIEEVWAFVSNIGNLDEWVIGVSEPRRTSDGEFGEGSTFASKYTRNKKTYEITYGVTRFDPPNQIIVKSTSGPYPFEGDVELERYGDATKVINTIDAGATTIPVYLWLTLFAPIARIYLSRELKKELAILKELLESAD